MAEKLLSNAETDLPNLQWSIIFTEIDMSVRWLFSQNGVCVCVCNQMEQSKIYWNMYFHYIGWLLLRTSLCKKMAQAKTIQQDPWLPARWWHSDMVPHDCPGRCININPRVLPIAPTLLTFAYHTYSVPAYILIYVLHICISTYMHVVIMHQFWKYAYMFFIYIDLITHWHVCYFATLTEKNIYSFPHVTVYAYQGEREYSTYKQYTYMYVRATQHLLYICVISMNVIHHLLTHDLTLDSQGSSTEF